jgi:hypothetical protein
VAGLIIVVGQLLLRGPCHRPDMLPSPACGFVVPNAKADMAQLWHRVMVLLRNGGIKLLVVTQWTQDDCTCIDNGKCAMGTEEWWNKKGQSRGQRLEICSFRKLVLGLMISNYPGTSQFITLARCPII